MKKIKFKLQWKLSLSFLGVVVSAIVIVGFLTNQNIYRHFQDFCESSGTVMPRCMQEEAGRIFLKSINNSLIWAGTIGAFISLLFGYILSRLILSPLQKVMFVAKNFSDGNYAARINATTNDEIDDLIKTLNEMFFSLEKLEKLRKDLVANLSHELSTPLTNIYGYLEALTDNVIKDGKERRKAIDLIKNETKRLIRLTKELKRLAILESDSFSLSIESTDLNNLINNISRKFETRYKEKSIKLKKQLYSGLANIEIDSSKFEQVIFNLLDNAIKYSFEDGIIEIKTWKDKGYIVVSIMDYGRGIDKENLPFIFERFYRADKARTKKNDSTGIGLTIVKKIIEAHKGDIKVKSEIGKGSEFIIYIPS